MSGHPIASCATLADVDLDGGRSRVVGALLWTGFAATALLVVLATFVVAFGGDDADRSYTTGEPVVSGTPSLAPEPLTVTERGLAGEALASVVDAHVVSMGLVPQGTWATVPPRAALPSAGEACALVALIAAAPGLSIDGTHTASAGRVSFTAGCPDAPSNGAHPLLARAFVLPDLSAREVAVTGVPPLVYLTHVLVERDARLTPYVPGDGLLHLSLSAAGFTLPGEARCVAWVGVVTHAGELVRPAIRVSASCHAYTPVPTSTEASDEIWLRPFMRKPGPHAERVHVPSNTIRRPMRTTTANDVLDTVSVPE